ncbi:hypothetical protein N9P11_02615 [Acidimicrobiia bacterium]|jgi:hypothetical protein|nr:hypothetical protein [Acidimicrobiia bacterium]
MNINEDNNTSEDNNDLTPSTENPMTKKSEESLVNDLKDSLSKSVSESIKMLDSLMEEVQEKVKEKSIKEETEKLVILLSNNLLNLTNENVGELDFNKDLNQSNLEEE